MSQPLWTTWVVVEGNTYPVRYQIAALGGTFDEGSKRWKVPAYQADAARAIVAQGIQADHRALRRLKKQRKKAKANRGTPALSAGEGQPRLVRRAS